MCCEFLLCPECKCHVTQARKSGFLLWRDNSRPRGEPRGMSSPQRSAVVAGDSIFRRRYMVALFFINPFLPSPRLSSRPSLRPLPGPSSLFSAFCPICLPLLFIFFPNLPSPQSLPQNFFLSPLFSHVCLSRFLAFWSFGQSLLASPSVTFLSCTLLFTCH